MYLPKIIERGVQDFLVKMGKWGGGGGGRGEAQPFINEVWIL